MEDMTLKKIFFVAFIIISITVIGQNDEFKITYSKGVFGRYLTDSSDVTGLTYVFPERIHETLLDSANGYLTVKLRGLSNNGKWLKLKGNILQYDLDNNSLLWSKKIAYNVNKLKQFGNKMILSKQNKSHCLDPNSGEKLWKARNDIYCVDPDYNIGMGYRIRLSSRTTQELEGIGMDNGDAIWSRPLNREFGWNDFFYIDDSTAIIVASGLHAINVNSGKGWDYHAITGKKDYSGKALGNVLGVAAGILTGMFMISSNHDLITGLVSNTIVDSTAIYFASKEQLAKIQKHSGKVLWKRSFPEDVGSTSFIFSNDSVLFMVNYGYANLGGRKVVYGEPFIAAFNRNNCKELYFHQMTVNNDAILDFNVADNNLYLVFKNKMAKYSLITGKLLKEKEISEGRHEELRYFIGNRVYITDKKYKFINLIKSDTSKIFVYTNEGKTFVMDKNLIIANTFEREDFGVLYYENDEYRFIASGKQTYVIDSLGKAVAKINTSQDSFVIGSSLYTIKNNKFIAIDLSKIIP